MKENYIHSVTSELPNSNIFIRPIDICISRNLYLLIFPPLLAVSNHVTQTLAALLHARLPRLDSRLHTGNERNVNRHQKVISSLRSRDFTRLAASMFAFVSLAAIKVKCMHLFETFKSMLVFFTTASLLSTNLLYAHALFSLLAPSYHASTIFPVKLTWKTKRGVVCTVHYDLILVSLLSFRELRRTLQLINPTSVSPCLDMTHRCYAAAQRNATFRQFPPVSINKKNSHNRRPFWHVYSSVVQKEGRCLAFPRNIPPFEQTNKAWIHSFLFKPCARGW